MHTLSKAGIPRHRHGHPREDPREEIARVGRKTVAGFGESVFVSMSVECHLNSTTLLQ